MNVGEKTTLPMDLELNFTLENIHFFKVRRVSEMYIHVHIQTPCVHACIHCPLFIRVRVLRQLMDPVAMTNFDVLKRR